MGLTFDHAIDLSSHIRVGPAVEKESGLGFPILDFCRTLTVTAFHILSTIERCEERCQSGGSASHLGFVQPGKIIEGGDRVSGKPIRCCRQDTLFSIRKYAVFQYRVPTASLDETLFRPQTMRMPIFDFAQPEESQGASRMRY